MEEIQKSWLAGLLEGEGYFGLRGRKVEITLWMTDRDVVEKASKMVGVDVSKKTRQAQPHHSVQYRLDIRDQNTVKRVLEWIKPYMGERRSKRIAEMLEFVERQQKSARYRELEISEAIRLYGTGVLTQRTVGQLFGKSEQWVRWALNRAR